MTLQQMEHAVIQSYTAQPLSRSEKSALSLQIENAALNAQQMSALRARAFAYARQLLDPENGAQVLQWLEDLGKILQRPVTPEQDEITEAWFSPHPDCPQRIRTALSRANSTIDICVFTITDDRLTAAILDAHGRGVRIRIITDNEKAADHGSDADRLLEAGIAVRVDRSEYHMHHKFAIFDNSTLLNGSYNWTRGAAESNVENFVITSNRKLVRAFSEVFEALWIHLAT